MIAGEFAGLGAAIERIPGRDGFGDVLIAHAPWNAETDGPGIMVLGHMDTVHPHGTIERLTVRRESDKRSEEHTSELQSLMRISYAVFCLKKKKQSTTKH